MLPPGKTTTTLANGRTYTCAVGAALASVPEFDAIVLEANGWLRMPVDASGATANRPQANNTARKFGFRYFDNTLGYIVVWDGVAWRNPSTGDSV